MLSNDELMKQKKQKKHEANKRYYEKNQKAIAEKRQLLYSVNADVLRGRALARYHATKCLKKQPIISSENDVTELPV